MISGYGLLFLVLVSASLFDLWQYRVPNVLCGAALMMSLIRRFEVQGFSGIFPWLIGIIVPFILCYGFFRTRMMGAGDSKLLSVVGSFVGVSLLLKILFAALCIGAVMSLIKMVVCHNVISRFQRLFQYASRCMQNRRPEAYYDLEQEGDGGVIPLSIAISLATLWCLYY